MHRTKTAHKHTLRTRCRKFLLEWLSFLHRYIPVGLLEVQSAAMNWRNPQILGRNDLETLFASENPYDWVCLMA